MFHPNAPFNHTQLPTSPFMVDNMTLFVLRIYWPQWILQTFRGLDFGSFSFLSYACVNLIVNIKQIFSKPESLPHHQIKSPWNHINTCKKSGVMKNTSIWLSHRRIIIYLWFTWFMVHYKYFLSIHNGSTGTVDSIYTKSKSKKTEQKKRIHIKCIYAVYFCSVQFRIGISLFVLNVFGHLWEWSYSVVINVGFDMKRCFSNNKIESLHL